MKKLKNINEKERRIMKGNVDTRPPPNNKTKEVFIYCLIKN